MPSVLDDHELDARWRAGLEAASEPGEAVTVETRVAHRAARRHRSRVGAAAGALVVVGALIAGVVIGTGTTNTTKVHTGARTGGSVFGTVIDGRPPGVARTADAIVEFRAPELVRREVMGRRIAVVLEALGPGTWTLRLDDVPGSSIPVRGENQLNATSTLYLDLEPGVHPITLTGARRGESVRTLHTELEVIAPRAQPASEPVASIQVVSQPTLTLQVTPLTVPAGIIEFEFSTAGGTHRLAIEGVPGFEMSAPNADSPTQVLKVELVPGQYVLSCTLPGHREAGEQATITVT